MSKRIRCKYFAQGACYKGESCEFSHDKQTPSRNICNFYQKGTCTYGSRCRYEHVKPSRSWHPASSSSTNAQSTLPDAVPQEVLSRARAKSGYKSVEDSSLKEPSVPCRLWHGASSSSGSFQTKVSDSISQPLSSRSALTRINLSSRTSDTSSKRPLVSENHDAVDNANIVDSNNGGQANGSVCPLAADGNCSRGENCPDVHGELCTVCGKYCLHPFKPQDREEHIKACEEKKRQLEALKLSEEIECSVCFDRVLSKPTAAERKFGILSECDHPFCITCIRNWRRSSPASGMDVNNALRACPICRKLSYFVVPSEVWYTTKEEKAEIIDNYKQRLKSIDCKHFSFGNGNCPFGTSCFYKHTVKPGSYTWVHQRPPPPRRRNRVNVDSMLDIFDFDNFLPDYLMGVDDDDIDLFCTLEDLIDPADYGLDEDNPLEMAFLLHHLGFDPSDDDLSDDEY